MMTHIVKLTDMTDITGLDQRKVTSLPMGIQLPLLDVLYPAHCNPPSGLPTPAYPLVHRYCNPPSVLPTPAYPLVHRY